MSTTTSAGSRATTRVAARLPAQLCAAAAVLAVAAVPVLGDRLTAAGTAALAGVAALLVLVAVVALSRAAARGDRDGAALRTERDALAAELATAAGALDDATAELARTREAREDQRAAVETAVVALGRKVQASAHRIQEEAARMVQRHTADPDVLQTSMRIDHAAAQHARQAQNLVALCGRRPGQTWDDPLALPDVVRAAAGRITAFQRVEISGDPGLAVVGRAVEPVVHVLAELLANATQCSPPSTQVLVAVRQVQRGAVVEIDDCGVGMAARELERVRAVASGARAVGIADLGEVPQTGLAVVGGYARALGLRVDLAESVYGGLRAVVMVPAELVTAAAAAPDTLAPSIDEAWPERIAPDDRPAPAPAPAPEAPATAPGPQGAPSLPQRRSRRGGDLATGAQRTVPAAPSAAPAAVVPAQTAEEAGAWIGAFFSADRLTTTTATTHVTAPVTDTAFVDGPADGPEEGPAGPAPTTDHPSQQPSAVPDVTSEDS
ncbi:ATP-binding protein [Isoptericola sp. NPDC019693]|uniref:ATP-binding protein n=1 Tax=Isoptericola sp. NPDC019693 TaxID=3364009 RepID=UPI00379F061C